MSRIFQGLVLAACVVLASAGSARANGWGYPVYGTAYYSAYYYPVYYPSYYYAVARPSYYYIQPVVPVYSPAVIRAASPVVTYAQPVATTLVIPCAQPLPVQPTMAYAKPVPAPASSSKEPAPAPISPGKEPAPAPIQQGKQPVLEKKQDKLPMVAESKAYSLGDAKEPATNPDGKSACRVGFWNVSGRDVTITINGKSHTVARDHNLTLTLGRTFSWQLDGRQPQAETVPDDQSSHEIVIRQ